MATFELGHTSRTMPRSASSATSAGSSIARTPCDIRAIGSSSAARTESGPSCSPAWTVQPRPEPAAISYARANRLAGQAASSPTRLKPTTYGWRSSAWRRAIASAASTPKLRTAAITIRASIPCASRASSMPWAMPA